MKRQLSILLAGALAFTLAGCAADTEPVPLIETSATAEATVYSAADAVTFTFTDDGITASGDDSGYKIDGCSLTIKESGTYVLSGRCADGSVKVKAGVSGVTLLLNGLDLTSADTAPIVCGKSSVVTLVAAEGTTNTLTDTAANNSDDNADNDSAENAVLKCKDGSQVTLCGTGSLTLNANGKNSIKSGAANTADNEPLDADGTITVTGGTILAAGGSSGMGMRIDAQQAYVTFGESAGMGGPGGGRPGEANTTAAETDTGTTLNLAAGDSFTLVNAAGETVYSGTAVCGTQYLFYSAADISGGESYSIGSMTATAQTGTATTGMAGGPGGTGGETGGPGGDRAEDFDPANAPHRPALR